MDAALAEIGAAFDEAAVVNAFKLRVEQNAAARPAAPGGAGAVFGARAALLRGRGLDAAIGLAERWWRAERKAFQIARAFGRGNSLSLDVLRGVASHSPPDALETHARRSSPRSSPRCTTIRSGQRRNE